MKKRFKRNDIVVCEGIPSVWRVAIACRRHLNSKHRFYTLHSYLDNGQSVTTGIECRMRLAEDADYLAARLGLG